MDFSSKDLCYRISSNAVIYELLDNELILANLQIGTYYSVKESGIPIWQLLMAGCSVNFIEAQFKKRYHLDFSSSILLFVNSLVKENLIIECEQEKNDSSPSSLFWPDECKEPLFVAYEEMKNLLLVDPIHEVDEKGWPSRF